jgi:GMP synthase (glutamine-hydrolysing)
VRCLAISHQRDAGPGVFAGAAESAGWRLDGWHIAESADPPGDPAGYDAVMTFGGAMHADQEDALGWLAAEKRLLAVLAQQGKPLLGVCLGAQLLAEAAGGSARRAAAPEIGWGQVEVTGEAEADPLLGPLAPGFSAFQWHSYECVLPPGAVALATSPVCLQAYRVGDRAWGIQFHAEVSPDDVSHWIDDYRSDEDAVRIGLDPDALRAETMPRIKQWNRLGAELCRRFLEAAAP